MIDDETFEGLLWFVRFENEDEDDVFSVSLGPSDFELLAEDIKKIIRI